MTHNRPRELFFALGVGALALFSFLYPEPSPGKTRPPVAVSAQEGGDPVPFEYCALPNPTNPRSAKYHFCNDVATKQRPIRCSFKIVSPPEFQILATTIELYQGRRINGHHYPQYMEQWIRIDHGVKTSASVLEAHWRIHHGTCGSNHRGELATSSIQARPEIRVSLAAACPTGYARDPGTRKCTHYTRTIVDIPPSQCPADPDPAHTNVCVGPEPARSDEPSSLPSPTVMAQPAQG
jgi:hypothetical protein